MISSAIKKPTSLVKLAHELIQPHLKSGDTVIDATVGNGHDTKFLLDLIKPHGMLFGFDIQQSAIESTQTLINATSNPECMMLICANHAQMRKHIPIMYHGKISAVMFNLGYLPSGNKQIITKTESSLLALTCACNLLTPGGILSILAYPGHQGGKEETTQVEIWCKHLNREHYQCRSIFSATENSSAPVLHIVCKSH